jgi:hypothetical protein
VRLSFGVRRLDAAFVRGGSTPLSSAAARRRFRPRRLDAASVSGRLTVAIDNASWPTDLISARLDLYSTKSGVKPPRTKAASSRRTPKECKISSNSRILPLSAMA